MAGAAARVDTLRYGVMDASVAACLNASASELVRLAGVAEQAYRELTTSPDASRQARDAVAKATGVANQAKHCGADRITISLDDTDEDAAPKVTATAMSVVVPALGQTVRYQHLLLPADSDHRVTVRARRTRRNP